MRRISVFCGSSSGNLPIFKEQARRLGQELAARNIEVVYGGGNVGLMGALADGALDAGGKVIGVLPYFLKAKELGHSQLTEMIYVDTMHERKAKMNELCDGVIALPGGFGTMEEMFEMLTWGQLSLHAKPVAVLNTDGYYNALLNFIAQMIEKGFLKEDYRNMLIMSEDIGILLDKMKNYRPPVNNKWFDVK
ncbi:MAG: TIGR00730 family Rossman fold protein [Prevotella sp.]|nr:TIGR00730 family Rossman fold protein [Prevotella sp.]